MKKVEYVVVTKKNERRKVTTIEAEAKRIVEKANSRGWGWSYQIVEYNLADEKMEWWELEGYLTNPEIINWNEEE